ncbi:MAG TPA: ABC transporter ATP-binding protein [Gammaproteobacteria bacterium]|nr:ABC transporter ATP-binding protein [Gammaproteobacteria bacterium]
MSSNPVLSVRNLDTRFQTQAGEIRAVDDVSFDLAKGEILGLVGESGSGKSVTGFSIMGLIDEPGKIHGGQVYFKGEDLAKADSKRYDRLRGREIAMIFQDPMMTLNPVLRIDTQIIESILAHENISKSVARQRARDALGMVGISSPDERLRAYPHQFSGGMRQRVVIAIAMLHAPEIIIADEPTTALDVTIQAQILYEMQKLRQNHSVSIIWITHDLSVISALADRVCVMYAGTLVEQGPIDDVLDYPTHPYTKGLIQSVPSRNLAGQRLAQIPGVMPTMIDPAPGCRFMGRCEYAEENCINEPQLTWPTNSRQVRCHYPLTPI